MSKATASDTVWCASVLCSVCVVCVVCAWFDLFLPPSIVGVTTEVILWPAVIPSFSALGYWDIVWCIRLFPFVGVSVCLCVCVCVCVRVYTYTHTHSSFVMSLIT